jgi:hypothetical protein
LAILRRWSVEPQNLATGGWKHTSDGARAAGYVNTFTAAGARRRRYNLRFNFSTKLV